MHWWCLFRRKISGFNNHSCSVVSEEDFWDSYGCIGFVISKGDLEIHNHGCIGSGVSEEDLEGLWELGFAVGVEIESWILGFRYS